VLRQQRFSAGIIRINLGARAAHRMKFHRAADSQIKGKTIWVECRLGALFFSLLFFQLKTPAPARCVFARERRLRRSIVNSQIVFPKL
jgi:hypothetical protein